MKPEKEAKALFDRFFNEQTLIDWTDDEGILKNAENNYLKNKDEKDIYWKKLAINSALIAADEILKQFIAIYNHFKNEGFYNLNVEDSANFKYWEEVKQEITKL